MTKTFVLIIYLVAGVLLVGTVACLESHVDGKGAQATKDSSDCILNKHCIQFTILSTTAVVCQQFELFYQLVYNSSNCAGIFSSASLLQLTPTNVHLFDLNKFDLTSFVSFTFGSNSKSIRTLILTNLAGVILSDNYANIKTWFGGELELNADEFVFYSQDDESSGPRKLPLDCSGYSRLSTKQKHQIELFMVAFNSMYLAGLKFPPVVCPILFNNVNMSAFTIQNPQFGRRFLFDQDSSTRVYQSHINADIKSLSLSNWHMANLNRQLLHPQVFSKIEILIFNVVSMNEIELDIFRHFSNLRQIVFAVNNIRNVYHNRQSGTRWMKYLNFNKSSFIFENKTKLSQDEINMIDKIGFIFKHVVFMESKGKLGIGDYVDYRYPDEDFCLFEKFPFERQVIFQHQFLSNERRNCSCTMTWLFRYYYLYKQAGINQNDGYIIFDCLNSEQDLNNSVARCEFKKRKALCQIEHTKNYDDDVYIKSYYLDQATKPVISFILSPVQSVVSFVGAVSNILALLTILYNWKRRKELMNKQKNKSDEIYLLKEPLYKQMLFSSIANALFSLLVFLDSVIPCDTRGSSQAYICFQKDLWISIVESFLKLVSNFCLLQMSVHRYMLVGKEHSNILERLGNIRTRSFIIVVAIVSSGLSSITYFQQTYWAPVKNIEASAGNQFQYGFYNMVIYYLTNASKYQKPEILNHFEQLTLIFSLVCISDLFSYFLYCLLSLVLDSITIKKLKETIKEKEKHASANFDKEKFSQIERKGLTMVVLSSLCNFLLRMPELISIVVSYFFVAQGNISYYYACIFQNDCVPLVSVANVFYMLSVSTNLVFYVKFNSNFNESFMKLMTICRKAADVKNQPTVAASDRK